MFRRYLVTPLTCLLALMLSVTSPLQAQSRGGLFPRTTDGIHLEMVFNFLQRDIGKESGHVDMVWGSDYATDPPGVYNTAYIPYSVDYYSYHLSWYQQNHPDWLEYQCDRTTLAFEFGATTLAPLDFSNPDVRAFQWNNWVDAPLALGYGGIAVDTIYLTNEWARCGHFDQSGQWVQQFTGNRSESVFRKAVLDWESATYQHAHDFSPTATMQVNVIDQFDQPQQDNRQMMTTTDLVFDERGFTNWGGGHVTPEEWLGIVKAIKYVQSAGVCYGLNGEVNGPSRQISLAQKLWIIANYLLVKDDCTYMYMEGYSPQTGSDYGRLILFPEYKIKIGHPLSDMAKRQGVWQRKYSGGMVFVNPSDQGLQVKLPPGIWKKVNHERVGPFLHIPRHAGQVLLGGKG